ncbi:hypothetical protein SeMB42_g05544 [Synchytrium endobioticum]|nr:hypothetical protein SeMB42_g05544 [Synchytrium endobioticum]
MTADDAPRAMPIRRTTSYMPRCDDVVLNIGDVADSSVMREFGELASTPGNHAAMAVPPPPHRRSMIVGYENHLHPVGLPLNNGHRRASPESHHSLNKVLGSNGLLPGRQSVASIARPIRRSFVGSKGSLAHSFHHNHEHVLQSHPKLQQDSAPAHVAIDIDVMHTSLEEETWPQILPVSSTEPGQASVTDKVDSTSTAANTATSLTVYSAPSSTPGPLLSVVSNNAPKFTKKVSVRQLIEARAQQKDQKASMGPRSLSIGAALCIPPQPRLSDKMNWSTFLKLSLGAVGIVYGDIGVGPLFVLKAVFKDDSVNLGSWSESSIDDQQVFVLGALSFVFWMITIVSCCKYMMFVIQADKHGEGGTFALLSLLPFDTPDSMLNKYKHHFYVAGIVSAAFLLGDGFIAPAIGVLSAFEGIHFYAPDSEQVSQAVMPLSCVVLLLLLFSQRFGTAKALRFYSPIMLLWFVSIGTVGLYNLTSAPWIFSAISPHYMVIFSMRFGAAGFYILSQVVLAVTGVEAMYADLGHFKTRPIRASFLGLVYPALVLSYFGQGAYILSHQVDPDTEHFHPFFDSVPDVIRWPMLALATLAAVIASQATISGAFALIDQAISLNIFPSVQSIHTSESSDGAVYIPAFNYTLMVGCVALIVAFGHSERLADIYGIAVCCSMTLTGLFFVMVLKFAWKQSMWKIVGFLGFFGVFDLVVLASSLRKIPLGGWVSFFISILIFWVMNVYYGTTIQINEYLQERLISMTDLRAHVRNIPRTDGTLVFVANSDEEVPHVLTLLAVRMNSLPENIICMSVSCSSAPFIAEEERTIFRTVDSATGLYRIVLSYGYAERSIDTMGAVMRYKSRILKNENCNDDITFVVGRERIQAHEKAGWMDMIRFWMYDLIQRNMEGKVAAYNLPPNDTMEIESRIILGYDVLDVPTGGEETALPGRKEL